MAKSKTKTKNSTTTLTPKQATAKAQTLLRGIDNNNAAIAKKLEDNQEAAQQLHVIIPQFTGLTNSTETVVRTAPKSTTPTKTPTAKKTAKKAAVAKTTNGTAKKTVSKAAAKPVAKPAAKTEDRPKLPILIREIISANGNQAMGSAEVFRAVTQDHKFSRQSVYNSLDKHFVMVGEKPNQKYKNHPTATKAATGEPDEADAFIEKVEANSGTAAVV
jgi:hypothetical protein